MPFAFAPYGLWPLAFLSTAVLYALVEDAEPGTALRLGWFFGLGYFGLGVYWVFYSIHLFGSAVAPLAATLTAAFVLVMSLFPLAICWLFARLHPGRQPALVRVVVFATLWLGSELLRDWLFGGFPWLALGYSQIDSVFAGYAPVLGVYGISLLVVLIAGFLVILLNPPSRPQRVGAALGLALLAGVAAALVPIEWTQPKTDPLQVRLVQGNIQQEMKFSRERLETSLVTYMDLSRTAPAETELIVWPETAIPTYFQRVEEVLEPFAEEMLSRGTEVLSGGFYRDEQNRAYNSYRQLGGEKALYRKRHLVPFGEFMPFRFVLDYVAHFIVIPMSDLSPGPTPVEPMIVHGEALGISICYEDVFGGEMRELLPASGILVNASNDAWFGDSVAPHQHQEIARMRSREFARPLIRVTNTGISASIDYRGRIVDSIAHDTLGVLDVSVMPRTGATPYVHYGNLPLLALVVLVLLVAGIAARRQPASSSD